jgi:hypothetical protein
VGAEEEEEEEEEDGRELLWGVVFGVEERIDALTGENAARWPFPYRPVCKLELSALLSLCRGLSAITVPGRPA